MKVPGLSKKKRSDHVVALDVGTEFVKVVIVETHGDEGAVTGVAHQRQRLGDMQSGAVTDIAGVVRNCEAALERAEAMAQARPAQAVIGIAGELVKGSTTTVIYHREEPT